MDLPRESVSPLKTRSWMITSGASVDLHGSAGLIRSATLKMTSPEVSAEFVTQIEQMSQQEQLPALGATFLLERSSPLYT